ncbi:MAG: hypothetical protein QMD23_02620 [Candidatus Bathyarchaeia archaeon]|nr:hypothetical protein [Candidatus Bathyarchaeia archaeon]
MMKNGELFDERTKRIVLGLHLGGEIIDKKEGTYGTVFIVDQGESVVPRHVAYKTVRETEKVEDNKLKDFVRELKQWFKVKGIL